MERLAVTFQPFSVETFPDSINASDPIKHRHADRDEISSRFRGTLLGTALALTSGTQLRLSEAVPIGPGELLLGAWLAIVICVLLLRGRIRADSTVFVVAVFWLGCLSVLGAGWITGLLLGLSKPEASRDFIALTLCALTSSLIALQPDRTRVLESAVTAYCAVLAFGLGLVLALTLSGTVSLGATNFTFGLRFTGLSLNPNQLALAVLPVPFLAAERSFRHRDFASRVVMWLAAGLSVVCGLASRSDALQVAWLCGAALCLSTILLSNYSTASGLWSQALRLLFSIALVAGGALAIRKIPNVIASTAGAVYQQQGQGSDRVARWRNGLVAAERSPMVGFGPGSFSGATQPFDAGEAHNNYIDWLDSTGVIGVSLLVAVLGWTFFALLRGGATASIAAFIALLVFTMFHYVARQPVYWFFLLVFMNPPISRTANSRNVLST